MINLLPSEYSGGIRLARQNSLIRIWLIGVIVAIIGLLAIIGLGFLYINQQSKNIQLGIDASKKNLQVQNLSSVQKQSKEISDNVKTIDQVLGKEVRFSSLIQDIAKILPQGSVLASLSIGQVDGAIDLTVNTVDHNSALQTAANLSDPKNNIFDKVDVETINCKPPDGTEVYYCTSTFRAVFGKTTLNRYLNVPTKAAGS
jgi:Tfp pilus assembly protein PilN